MSRLLDRKPHLLRPLSARLLPPPLAAIDPARRLGIDLAAVRTASRALTAMRAVLAAVSAGEIAPAEAGRIARRVRARLRLPARRPAKRRAGSPAT